MMPMNFSGIGGGGAGCGGPVGTCGCGCCCGATGGGATGGGGGGAFGLKRNRFRCAVSGFGRSLPSASRWTSGASGGFGVWSARAPRAGACLLDAGGGCEDGVDSDR